MALKHASPKAAIAGFTPVNRNGQRAPRREIEPQQDPEETLSVNHREHRQPQEPERINQIRKVTTERSAKRRRVDSGQHEADQAAAEAEARRVKLQHCEDIFCNLIRDIMPVVGPADLEASFRRAFARVCDEAPRPPIQNHQPEVQPPNITQPAEGPYQSKESQAMSGTEIIVPKTPHSEASHTPLPRIEAPYAPTAHLYQPPPQIETPYAPTAHLAETNQESATCSPAGLVRKARAIKAIRSCWGPKSDIFDLDSRGELYLHQLSSISKKFTVENAAVLVTKTTIRRLRSTSSGTPWRESTYKDWKAMKGLSLKETEELMREPDLSPDERAQYEIPYGLLFSEKIGDAPATMSEVLAGVQQMHKRDKGEIVEVTSDAE